MAIELVKLVSSLFLAVLIHEGGHVAATHMVGGEVTEFNVFSHGQLGYTEALLPSDKLGHFYAGGVTASIASLPAIRWACKKYPDETFFKYWDFWATMDVPYQAVSCLWRPNSDFSKISKHTDINKSVLVCVGLLFGYLNKNVIISDGKVFIKKAF